MGSNFSCWGRTLLFSFLAKLVKALIRPPIASSCHLSIPIFDRRFGHTMRFTFNLNWFGKGNSKCGAVTNSHNNIVNVNNVITDESPEIMQWLSPLDPGGRHQDVLADRLDGVGNWLLETKEFRAWRSNGGGVERAVLFCYGNPGVGKTYLR